MLGLDGGRVVAAHAAARLDGAMSTKAPDFETILYSVSDAVADYLIEAVRLVAAEVRDPAQA